MAKVLSFVAPDPQTPRGPSAEGASSRLRCRLTTRCRRLANLDALVTDEVRLHCFVGFVVTTRRGMARPQPELDVLSILPSDDQCRQAAAAGRGSELDKAHEPRRPRTDGTDIQPRHIR